MTSKREIHALHTRDNVVRISTYGAQVIQWEHKNSAPVLWYSPKSDPSSALTLRGGIPICLPWFGKPDHSSVPLRNDAPAHGFARQTEWTLETLTDNSAHHRFVFEGSDAFPHRFIADLNTTLSSDLILTLTITNNDDHEWTFEQALHTYFHVGDIKDVSIHGLGGCPYRTAHHDEHVDYNNELTLVTSIDRVYTTKNPISIEDPRLRRRINIDFDGASSVIVWTPWAEGSADIVDIPDSAWDQFLCVEIGNVWTQAVCLAPEQSHTLSMRLNTEPL